jgi:NAD-dependent dihydropyrimidine dehydrogenase PreA subunit
MHTMRYLPGVSTLTLNTARCNGCRTCTQVCPHAVLEMNGRRVMIARQDDCMECGACTRNCPQKALGVTPGVGCAAYVLQTWFKGKEAACCGESGCC